ncbi:hypothetical protein [Microbacterium sp. zg-YB36]|uniref:hypothetical protein n=1 Tax=Microbacterium sp. zg-YB36 TaxID=2969407 RepID=UPI00214CCF9E|nr:hypothetical protein [Microbacterium sp. zg-YB36]MDL5351592.1 hypothetical protein [Microbacterium sp. zg-YB36]
MRTRPLPLRKSLGTEFNLRPDTERVRAGALRVGDVVMEDFDHPVIIMQLNSARGSVTIHGNYVWERATGKSWFLGKFNPIHMFDRALPGEY